ncbi:MAG TPA: hypothetical protein VHM70_18880 [Polyangiaceae bacterium]|jgi:hypothetical protein|nr:hypothetical protein [Polyangiaceae bacterium]
MGTAFASGGWACLLASATLALALLGCNSKSEPTNKPMDEAAPSVSEVTPIRATLEPGQISRALDALLTPLPKPLRILTITALPTLVVAQVQNAQNPSEVHQYSFRDGKVEGPERVKLMGRGSLKDNLFRPPSADPHMAEEALKNVTAQYKHPAHKLIMIRNLPESMDIQFRVFLDTGNGDLVVVTDKHGRVLGPIVPTSNTAQ